MFGRVGQAMIIYGGTARIQLFKQVQNYLIKVLRLLEVMDYMEDIMMEVGTMEEHVPLMLEEHA